jgi:hypothetical protein
MHCNCIFKGLRTEFFAFVIKFSTFSKLLVKQFGAFKSAYIK